MLGRIGSSTRATQHKQPFFFLFLKREKKEKRCSHCHCRALPPRSGPRQRYSPSLLGRKWHQWRHWCRPNEGWIFTRIIHGARDGRLHQPHHHGATSEPLHGRLQQRHHGDTGKRPSKPLSAHTREIYKVEHNKIRNWKILLKLFIWKFQEKLIISSSFIHIWNRFWLTPKQLNNLLKPLFFLNQIKTLGKIGG